MRHFAEIVFLRIIILLTSIIAFHINIRAQGIALGTWKSHFSYHNTKRLISTKNKIFCASQWGFYSINKKDFTINTLSKNEELGDVGVTALHYDFTDDILLVGYHSGHVDFIHKQEIFSFSEIANSDLPGNKSINHIAVRQNRVYLATDIGIVVLDKQTREILENVVNIGPNAQKVEVKKILFSYGQIIIHTTFGIQTAFVDDNLLDFAKWVHVPNSQDIDQIGILTNNIYALKKRGLYELKNRQLQTTNHLLPMGASKVHVTNNNLYAMTDEGIYQYEKINGFVFKKKIENIVAPTSLLIENNSYWIGDKRGTSIDGRVVIPKGPLSDTITNMKFIRDQLFVFHNTSPIKCATSKKKIKGHSIYDLYEWKSEYIPNFNNVSDVTFFDNGYFFTSVGGGLYDQSNNKIIKNLLSENGSAKDTLLTGVYSSDEQLYVTAEDKVSSLFRYKEGKWISYTKNLLRTSQIKDIKIVGDYIWILDDLSQLILFDAKKLRIVRISSEHNVNSDVNAIFINRREEMWLAQKKGISSSYESPIAFFDPINNTPKLLPWQLSKNQDVSVIFTDGGNRIWLATMEGLFVFDEYFENQILHLHTKNSPLPSNKIRQLSYNPKSGEIFILTSKGLVSYRTDSSVGMDGIHEGVNIFPNPVRPEYQGLVGIQGVAHNSTIKIMDINRNLVRQLKSNGGTASWDLLDANYKEVKTGIYLLFITSENQEDVIVKKIAIIR